MGKFIVAVLLAVGVWYFFIKTEAPETPQPANADGTPDFSMEGDDTNKQPSLANPDSPDVPEKFSAALKEADQTWKTFKQEKTDATLHDLAPTLAATYSGLLRQTYNKPHLKKIQLEMIKQRLDPLAKRLFFSSKTYKKDTSGLFAHHEIKEGERLGTIGKKYGMSSQFINILRGKDPDDEVYRKGEDLKLLNAKSKGYQIHIDKSDYFMDLYVCSIFIRRYPIGHGAPEKETPTGETFIEARVLHPTWTNPEDNKTYRYGEPGHILGPVWLAFNKEIGKGGLGIHGYTGDGQATGVQGSNGCIRMKNDQAQEVYNLLVPVVKGPPFITRAPMKVAIVE